jgi:sugar/nucleoside kinase (ribokinase family)
VKVVVYGSVNWDEIYQLPRYPNEHEKVRGTGFRGHLGGSAANTATWLAGYVADVAFVGAVGNDAEGGRCLDALERAGVYIASVEICHAVPTARASSWVAGNDKRISIFRDPRLWRDHATPLALEASSAADHIHLASHVDKAGIECLTAAIEGGASVSIELSGKPHDDVRPLADIVFLNAEELVEVFGLNVADLTTDQVEQIAPKEGSLLVVTAGARAIHCASRERVEVFSVQPIDTVVDRTGGGDSFDAGFLAAWLEGASHEDAVAKGQATSRQALNQFGASRNPG